MDPVKNPFSPGAGTPPPELAGREPILERARIALERIKARRSEKSLLIVGLRGVGKTVLLNRVGEIAESTGYRVVPIEAHEGKKLPALLIPHLRKLLLTLDAMQGVSDKVKRGLRVLKSFLNGVRLTINDIEVGLNIDPEPGAADSGDLEADLTELFVAIAEAANDRGTAVAIIVDELQYLSEAEMSALIMAVHRISQLQLPLVVLGAGLPQLVGLTGRSKSYSERLFDFPEVGPLSVEDATDALQEPLKEAGGIFSDDSLALIIEQTKGYPYFLQEWAYHAWNISPDLQINKSSVEQACVRAIERLDESFFRVRFDRLTPREKDYLRAMSELGPGPHRSGDIADVLGVAVQTVAPLRSGLIKKGMIYSPAHGDTAFTVPLFDQFMKRVMPRQT